MPRTSSSLPRARRPLASLGTGLRLLAIFTVLLGLAYPLAVTGLGAVIAPAQAAGSLVREGSGRVVGSELIGQNYLTAAGEPDPGYFQPRPSAGDYDAMSSGGSNLGPSNPELVQAIRDRKAAVVAFEGVGEDAVPADAVTASASGLDPDISPAYARLQAQRVARERGLDPSAVLDIVERAVSGTGVWLPGQDRVNVLRLNVELDRVAPRG